MPLQPPKETTAETKSYWLTKHHPSVLSVYGNQSNTEIEPKPSEKNTPVCSSHSKDLKPAAIKRVPLLSKERNERG